jgi:hypothetical protein
MPTKTVRNATDTFVRQATASKNYGHAGRMQIRNQSGDNRYGYVFFNRPFPLGVRILNAELRVWTDKAITGAFNLTGQLVTSKWSANKINWTNDPGVVGTVASLSISDAAAGTLFALDVTDEMQDVSDGQGWYGFRLATTTASKTGVFKSAQNSNGTKRPVLYVEWTTAPDVPSDLTPSGGYHVSSQTPVLMYDFEDPDGEGDLARSYFQIAADEDGLTIDFDPGWLNTDLPKLDLSTTAYGGLPSGGGSKWWRVMAEDEDGEQSGWSDWAEMAYAALGTPSISVTFDNGAPEVSWGLTGQTQKSYQVFVSTPDDPSKWLWDSGKVTSTDNAMNIPFGVLKNDVDTYRFGVRLWDTVARVSQPGAPAYVEATADEAYGAGAATGVSSLASSSDAVKPIITLTWTRASAADEYHILRRRTGTTAYRFFDSILEEDANTGGTSYAWSDIGVDWYKPYEYKVIAVDAGVGSPGSTTSAQARKLAPFLMRPDGTDVVCFLNPDRSRNSRTIQELHERMEGPPVLVTQTLGGYTGRVKGMLVDNWPSGYTAEQMRESFESIMADAGKPMKLSYADQCLPVVPFDMDWDSFADNEGIYYIAEFSWVAVD